MLVERSAISTTGNLSRHSPARTGSSSLGGTQRSTFQSGGGCVAGPTALSPLSRGNLSPLGAWEQRGSRLPASASSAIARPRFGPNASHAALSSAARSPAARKIAHAAAVREFVAEPSQQTDLLHAQVVDWLRCWDREVSAYGSVAVFAELKLQELLAMTAELPKPHPVHAAACCHVLERSFGLFGRYESLLRPLWREVLSCIYVDAHVLDAQLLGALPLGSCDRHLSLEPWFSRYDLLARRCAQLEAQLAHGTRAATETAGAAEARDAQLGATLSGWQRELVRVKALSDTADIAEAQRVSLAALGAQAEELALQLATCRRELRLRTAELDAARLENAELHLSPPVSEAVARDVAEIKARFRSLPASAQGMLARELLRSVGVGGGGGPIGSGPSGFDGTQIREM
jgi:hypothetical protein